MNLQEIYESLCSYDTRNPNYIEDDRPNWCVCDNCFRGKTKLAEYVLELLDTIELLTDQERCD